MATAPIDYTALAKSMGAVSSTPPPANSTPIDYTALAKSMGAIDSTPPQQGFFGSFADGASDFGKGLAKGALHTVSAADDWATQHLPAVMTTPIGQTPNHANSVAATQYAQQLATPTNTAQKIGKGVEQAGEFLIPGGLEEGAGRAIAAKYPRLASTASKLISSSAPELNAVGKIVMSALGAGTVNAVQGGSFGGGAAAGAAGGVLAQGVKAVAPSLAEIAMGTRATDRVAGRAAGQTLLDETTGINPGNIAKQAFDKSSAYTDTLNSNALQSNVPIDLQPARNVAQSFAKTAAKQNNASNMKEIQELEDQLATHRATGTAIPQVVSADQGLGMKRGVDALMDSWNPNNKRALSDSAVVAVRSAMNDELSKAVPDYAALNSKISNLLPVAQRAGATDLNAGVLQRVVGKMAKPTGALVGTIAGGTGGYEKDGWRGALIGGALGAVLPEVATSPTTIMMGARAANSAVPSGASQLLAGAGMQAARDDAPPSRGAAKWAQLGLSKLMDHINRDQTSPITLDDLTALQNTPQGKDRLVQASDLNPGSAAMKSLVKQISAEKNRQ